jgi:hydroxymethylglutaryl-CoA lyase
MQPRINIVEVGPRDGLQMEPGVLPTAIKVEFIRRAVAAGVRRIEVASFVNPRRVPQMADAEAVLAALPRRAGVSYIGLVLNRRGFERAVDAGCDEIGMAVAASDTFNRRNQGSGTDDSIAAWLEIAADSRSRGIRCQVTISAAFGCPFEGEVAPARVAGLARRLAGASPFEITLADTIGVAVPAQVASLIGRVREAIPGDTALRCHFHNTRNTGLANAFAAVQAGVTTLDGSLGGIGGCPFAPGATGNVPTEDLLYMLHRSGYATGISIEAAIEAATWLQEQLGRTVPGMLVKAGDFPRTIEPLPTGA